MHCFCNQRWGIVQFQSERQLDAKVGYYAEWPSRCAAMAIYYAMKAYYLNEGQYTTDIGALREYSTPPFELCEKVDDGVIHLTANGYDASVTIGMHTATVNEERYLFVPTKTGSTSQT